MVTGKHSFSICVVALINTVICVGGTIIHPIGNALLAGMQRGLKLLACISEYLLNYVYVCQGTNPEALSINFPFSPVSEK